MIARMLLILGLSAVMLAGQALAEERIKVRFGDHKGHSRAVFDWGQNVGYRIEEADGAVRIHFDRPASFDFSNHARMRPRAIGSVSVTKDGKTVVLWAASGQVSRDFRLGTRVVVDVAATKTKKRPKAKPKSKPKVAKTPPKKPKAKPARKAANPPKTRPSEEGAVQVTLEQRPARTLVRFAWPAETGLAALHRGGHVWLGFSNSAPLSLPEIAGDTPGPLTAILAEPSNVGTLVRLDVAPGAAMDVTKDGQDWVIDIGGGRGRAERTVQFEPQAHSAQGPRIFAALKQATTPMIVDDPLIGDRIALVPVTSPGLGVRPARQMVQLDLPATPQGVAVRFKSLDLRIDASEKGLVIRSGHSLNLAVEAEHAPAGQAGLVPSLNGETDEPSVRTILALGDWRGEGPMTDTRHKLLRRIVEAKPAARNLERRALAGFLVSYGLGPEALGVMNRIEEEDRRAEFDPVYRAQRGLALMMAGRFPEAKADLGHRRLKDMADIALYRGLLAARQREFETARREFTEGWQALESLPKDVQPQFRMALAETALHLNDIKAAEEQLEYLVTGAKEPAQKEQALLLSARISSKIGEVQEAGTLLGELTQSRRRDVRAKARFDETNLMLAEEQISPRDAVEKMERLRFAWRGDVFEFDLLKRLGELYIETGNYRDGLVMMRRTIDQFPDLPEAQRLSGRMNAVFAELFEGRHAEAMSPVTAMGLYYDFRELTPEGGRGDKMIQSLADRLAAVELLDEAAKLLEHQLAHRAKGVDRTRVGTRLAVLYLLDDQPRKAIDALRASRSLNLPADLVRERRMLESRGLTELGRYERALVLLNGLYGDDADNVRTEILWRARKWQRAATSLSQRLVNIRTSDGPLAADARHDVLRFAIASSLASDTAALTQVRGDFEQRMKGHPEWPAFQIVTAEDQRDSAEFRNLAAQIAQVDRFESFMASYRDRLREAPLSAIN